MGQRDTVGIEDLSPSMEKDGPQANGYAVCAAERVWTLTQGDLPDTNLEYRHVPLENGAKGIVRYWRGTFYIKAL
jgi:hypothetical protein